MKKFRKLFLTAAFAFLSFNIYSYDVTFVSVTGKVQYQDGDEWITAKEGDSIEQGAVISTGYKSEATLSAKKSTFKIGPMTRISIEQLSESDAKDNAEFYLDSGSLHAEVNSDGKATGFKVKSAVATASVRGTVFTVTSSGKLYVERGEVSFSPGEKRADSSQDDSEKLEGENDETSAGADSGTTTDGASGTTTGTEAVSTSGTDAQDKGIPVSAGQSSTTNSSTGGQSSPKTEKVKAAVSTSSGTTSASQAEKVTSSSASSTSSSTEKVSQKKEASLKVNIFVEQ